MQVAHRYPYAITNFHSMNRYFTFLFLCLPFFVMGQTAFSPKITTSLQAALQATPHQKHKTLLLLRDCIDMEKMDAEFYRRNASLYERTYQVITQLKAKANTTQPPVIQALSSLNGVNRASITPMWITNMIAVEMDMQAIITMSENPAIDIIDLDTPAQLEPFRVEKGTATRAVNGKEPGLAAIKADKIWKMGYTGYGRAVMSIDTGVDPTHPAIDNQFRGLYVPANQAWYESNSSNTTPSDCDSHGTHTVGTMVGLDANTHDTIGVAFNAQWMGSPGLCQSNKYMAFQWALNPDNNPNTILDMPDAINNSWYDPSASNECTSAYYKNIFDACEAAGIAVVFSAGNNGPGVSTITNPKNINTNLVNVFAIGNVNGNTASFPINSSSSRGPSICGGTNSLLIKPEVSAPGTNVRSCIPGGSYALYTGTSMAAPHATGAIALLKEAFPTLTGTQIKLALYYTADDLGVAGEDNEYGMGIINLESAFNYLVQQGNTPVSPSNMNNLTAASISNVSSNSCTFFVFPFLNITNSGLNPITTATIAFSFSNGITDTLYWTGNLAVGQSTIQVITPQNFAPGNYTLNVSILDVNGGADDREIDNDITYIFNVLPTNTPTTTGATICANNSALLTATASSPGTIKWYQSATGGLPVGIGSPFLTPSLASATTYFADIVQSQNAGKVDSVGAGQYDATVDKYMIFDAYVPFLLKEVTVYAQSAGTRVIELRNASGNVLKTRSVNLTTGKQVVSLNFDIPQMDNLQIGLSGTNSGLYTNNPFGGLPLTKPGLLSIKTTSGGNSRYFYFYDWKIEAGSACGRGIANVSVISGALSANFSPSTTLLDLSVANLVTFTDNSQGATQWLWDFGDGVTSTLQNPTHNYYDAGVYTVTLTTSNGSCTATTTTQITVTGVSALSPFSYDDIQLFPNPAQDKITVAHTKGGHINIQLLDGLGRNIYTVKSENTTTEIQVQDLPSGLYYLYIRTEKGEGSFKFIKE